MKKQVLMMSISVFITILGLMTDGIYVETQEERSQLWDQQWEGMELGFPLPFVIQGPSQLDPPLPHKFGFEFNAIRDTLCGNLIVNVLLIYGSLWVVVKAYKIVSGRLAS